MNNIVLVERYHDKSFYWPNLVKNKKIDNLSIKEILTKYQGFAGIEKEVYSLKNDDPDFKEIVNLFSSYPNLNKYVLLYVTSSLEQIQYELKNLAYKVGYDVGMCTEENIFSSITSEIIFGSFDELVSYKNALNENFLFPDRNTAEKYVTLHNEMSEKGLGVEDFMPMVIYEIWKFKT